MAGVFWAVFWPVVEFVAVGVMGHELFNGTIGRDANRQAFHISASYYHFCESGNNKTNSKSSRAPRPPLARVAIALFCSVGEFPPEAGGASALCLLPMTHRRRDPLQYPGRRHLRTLVREPNKIIPVESEQDGFAIIGSGEQAPQRRDNRFRLVGQTRSSLEIKKDWSPA